MIQSRENSMNNYEEKKQKLLSLIDEYTKKDLMIAFSGGVDSSLLLKLATEAALKNKNKVYALTIHTKLHPINDITVSKKVASELKAEHAIIEVDELKEAEIAQNPVDRCYLCKKHLFTRAALFAKENKVAIVIDGTNADDQKVYRPGIKALKELGVLSPLALCEMSKEDIRKMAAEYKLSVSNRPSSPCLATRFPYGSSLSYEKMAKIDEIENFLREKAFNNVRVRAHDDIARIEVDINDIEKTLALKNEIIKKVKDAGFEYVTLDLEGFRSGSMDYKLKK